MVPFGRVYLVMWNFALLIVSTVIDVEVDVRYRLSIEGESEMMSLDHVIVRIG